MLAAIVVFTSLDGIGRRQESGLVAQVPACGFWQARGGHRRERLVHLAAK